MAYVLPMDRDERQALAKRIPQERKDQGLSQEELAASVGISRRQLGKIERGDEVPRESTLAKLLDVLGLNGRDIELDADLQSLMTVIGHLVKRLSPEQRVEWAGRITEELTQVIRGPKGRDRMEEMIQRARATGGQTGQSNADQAIRE